MKSQFPSSCLFMKSQFILKLFIYRLWQIIAKSKGLDWRTVRRLGEVQKLLGVNLEDMVDIVGVTFPQEAYSKQEVCDLLEVTADELNQISLTERSRQGTHHYLTTLFYSFVLYFLIFAIKRLVFLNVTLLYLLLFTFLFLYFTFNLNKNFRIQMNILRFFSYKFMLKLRI